MSAEEDAKQVLKKEKKGPNEVSPLVHSIFLSGGSLAPPPRLS
jgi:hypothetical protein